MVQEENRERHTSRGLEHHVTPRAVASCRRGQGGGQQSAGADSAERHVLSSCPVDAGAAQLVLNRLLYRL